MQNTSEKEKTVEKINTAVLSGFMELLPAQQLAFDRIKNTIARCYELFGFAPLDTPIIERAEVLLAKAGGETEKQIYQFQKGEHDLALRFDLTVPLARYVSEHLNDLVFPFRRYQIGKVYRGERPQKGRFREFYQCDIDIIGRQELALVNDAEIPCIIYTTFKELGFERFTIRLNNRKLLNGVFAELGTSSNPAAVLRTIDKLEKIGADAVTKELQGLGISLEKSSQLLKLLAIKGSPLQIVEELKSLGIQSELFATGLRELGEVATAMLAFGLPERNFGIDLTIARGLDYYTGTVYETRLDDYPALGSVCSGGRYDNLAEYYTNVKLPGVGISIGLTRLFDQLLNASLVTVAGATPSRALIVPMVDDLKPCLELATQLRQCGLAIQLYTEAGKFRDKLRYADKLGVPFVVIIGSDELASSCYSLKDMRSGEQKKVGLEELKTVLAQ